MSSNLSSHRALVGGALVALAIALRGASARADGALATAPPGAAAPRALRVALAAGPSQTTWWLQATLAGDADAVLWVLPVRGAAAVDRASSAWLDALEDATAPRVRPPVPKAGCVTSKAPAVVTPGDAVAPAAAAAAALVESPDDLAAVASSWGFDGEAASAALGARADGQRWLALRLAPATGAGATPTVRVTGASLGALPFAMSKADPAASLPATAWLIGQGRGHLEGVDEAVVGAAGLRWVATGEVSYDAARAALLAAGGGASAVVDAASGTLLTVDEDASGASAPSVLRAFVERAVARGEASGDPSSLESAALAALAAGPAPPAPCPRADFAATDGFTCASPAGPNALVVGPLADDFAFAAAAGPWVTRLSLLAPAGTRLIDRGVSFDEGPVVDRVRDPLGGVACDAGPSPSSSARVAPPATDPPSHPPTDANPDDTSVPDDGRAEAACAAFALVDSCDGDQGQSSSGDGCGKADSGDESSGDGCGKGDSGGEADKSSCSLHRRSRRSHVSPWLTALAALTLVVRRRARSVRARRGQGEALSRPRATPARGVFGACVRRGLVRRSVPIAALCRGPEPAPRYRGQAVAMARWSARWGSGGVVGRRGACGDFLRRAVASVHGRGRWAIVALKKARGVRRGVALRDVFVQTK